MLTIVPTIDVEGTHGEDPFSQLIIGEIGEPETWGVHRLSQTFQDYGVRATFFVDCYEHTFWGEDKMEEVCQKLVEANQDVQLHTHPAWRDDIHDSPWLRTLKRTDSFFPQELDLMAKLSLSQQVEVLEFGADLIQKWVGYRPVVHRSGGYSINQQTVRALVKTGFLMDSSMNTAHSNSKINWSFNSLRLKDGLLECPVTVLNYTFGLPLGFTNLPLYSKKMKTDLDSCTVEDITSYVRQSRDMGIKILNLFMHSYSLLKFDPFFRNIQPDPSDLQKLQTILADLSGMQDVRFMSCIDLLRAYQKNREEFASFDGVPSVQRNLQIIRFAIQKARNLAVDFSFQVHDTYSPPDQKEVGRKN